MEFLAVVSCFSVIIMLSYLYMKWTYSYWGRKNVPYIEPTFPFGSMELKKHKHSSLQIMEFYNKSKREYKEPIIGIYLLYRPVLLVTDLEMVRHILIKDFQCFSHRGIYHNPEHDPLSGNLFNVEYEQWKQLRSKMTPTLTTGKMKLMFPIIVSVADDLVKYLNIATKIDSETQILDWLGRFTTDVIGTCAFGIDCNSLRDPDNEFRRMGGKVLNHPKLGFIERMLIGPFSNFAKAIGVRTHYKDVTTFFTNCVNEIISYRESNNVQRNDFVSLLIDLKNLNDPSKKLTMNEISAQAFAFFLGGFDPSSSTLAFCLYELSLDKNKNIQNEARLEINSIVRKHNGNLTYEAINEMVYIEQVLNETLRRHSPAPDLTRVATRSFKIPNSHFTIPKGMPVIVPARAIHHDPEIYENPEVFDPRRFEPEQIQSRPPCSFMPFGDGPRNCIAARFGKLQAKIGLVKLLQHFEFSTCSRTVIPMKYSAKKLGLAPDGGLWLRVTELAP